MGDQPAGSRVRCPHCRTTFRVPELGGGPLDGDDNQPSTVVRETFKGVFLIIGLSAIVLIMVAGIILLVKLRNNPEPAQQWFGALAEYVANFVNFAITIGLFVAALLYWPVVYWTAGWIAKDAYNRNLPGLGWATLFLFFQITDGILGFYVASRIIENRISSLILVLVAIGITAFGWAGLFIYLVARRPGLLIRCEKCNNRRLNYVVVCPHCGANC